MKGFTAVTKILVHRLCCSTISLAGLAMLAGSVQAQSNTAEFDLTPNPKFVSCLGAPGETPSAHVKVVRGKLNDTLTISAKNIKPGLGFDMFTVQRSSLLADGTPDPN